MIMVFFLLTAISCSKTKTSDPGSIVTEYALETQAITGTISGSGISFDSLDVNFGEVLPRTKLSQKISIFNNSATSQLLTISSTIVSPFSLTKNCGTSLASKRSCTYTIAGTINNEKKILIGGNFTMYNGIPRNRIARINTDGSIDTTFDPGVGASTELYTIGVQPDVKIILGGGFQSFNNLPYYRIVRLNSNGTLE